MYDCEKFLAKFQNNTDLDNGTKGFEEFEKQNTNDKVITNNTKNVLKKTSNTHLNEEFWNETENKANTEEGATSLR